MIFKSNTNQTNSIFDKSISNAAVLTIPQLVLHAGHVYNDNIAIEDDGENISYTELSTRALAVCKSLINSGVKPGDRVAIWLPNCANWVIAALGLQMAGAILVPLNTRMKPIEAADILERSGTKILFIMGDFLGLDYPAALADVLPNNVERQVVVTERTANDTIPLIVNQTWQQFLAMGNSLKDEVALERANAVKPDDIADLMFTSGTTGKPKGVMSSHRSCLLAFTQFVEILGLEKGDRYLVVNPFFHAFGYKAGWLTCLIAGATILPHKVFDANEVIARIETDKVTVLPGPPTLYLSMLSHPKLSTTDLSSLRVAVTGAATIPPILIERMRSELGFKIVTTAYGLTECGGLATICRPDEDVETIAKTSGSAIKGTQISIQSNDGQFLGNGVQGEICLKGFHVMQGYFQDEAATTATIDGDDWLHTGDIGMLDERGNVTITGRLKDMFIVGGFNCYPAEIEAVLAEHDSISLSAVIGVPCERMGEVGCAYVIRKPGSVLNEEELIQWSRSRMANYKVPRHIRFVESMPVNASNKVLKAELAETFSA
ncbi:AMP-dependent synthetase and ligase [Shewanella halifaxensis HAW-EB4]|uniref:AMP-dependent synthetase and ligase n=1 Tax=Shewanella halifaxensis (strain HAW-EB4) TaxID=458817 RepID=B0TTT9_SHEHH|nr:FadD3 family acyl-CoA ligase [Shewanella halifaxensis]ABZ76657.1 AMP-dependent synthetase and ligase [Shewanella halifaxensis HAW-EB4]